MKMRPGSSNPVGAAVLLAILTGASAVSQAQPVRIDPPLHPRATVVRGSPVAASPKNFGTQDLIADVVSGYDFQPFQSVVGYESQAGVRAALGPGNFQMGATFGRLPHGAVIESFTVYYYDNNAALDVDLRACRGVRNTLTGEHSPSSECFAQFTSSGTPEFSAGELPVPAEFQDYLLVADIDGDLADDTVDYLFIAETPAGDISTAIGAIKINWRRRVSPAPAVATFNDVATGHPQFQFIEALASSGITAGCGAGSYCPDATLTRGQMAVFMAKALGLHWSP